MILYGMIMKALGVGMPASGTGGSGNGFGVQPLTSGLDFSSAFAGRANGGPVAANTPYIVGENRQPELFVPNQAGTIYNQDQMRSAMTAYSPANESMGPASMQPIKVDFMSQTIAGEEYVTARQFRQGLIDATNQGAKIGEQRSMNRLRQSRSTRSKIGL